MGFLKRNLLFEGLLFRFHVKNFRGVGYNLPHWSKDSSILTNPSPAHPCTSVAAWSWLQSPIGSGDFFFRFFLNLPRMPRTCNGNKAFLRDNSRYTTLKFKIKPEKWWLEFPILSFWVSVNFQGRAAKLLAGVIFSKTKASHFMRGVAVVAVGFFDKIIPDKVLLLFALEVWEGTWILTNIYYPYHPCMVSLPWFRWSAW